MNYIPTVEDLLTLNILLYDIHIVNENNVGELARRSVQNYENTVRLLRYNNHKIYVNNIDPVLQSFCCPNCDNFFSRTFNLERRLTTCNERVKMSIRGTYIKPKKLCWTSWTLLELNTLMSKPFSET